MDNQNKHKATFSDKWNVFGPIIFTVIMIIAMAILSKYFG